MDFREQIRDAAAILADVLAAGGRGDMPHRAAERLLADLLAAVGPGEQATDFLVSWLQADLETLDHWRNSAMSVDKPERAEIYRRIIECRKAACEAVERARKTKL